MDVCRHVHCVCVCVCHDMIVCRPSNVSCHGCLRTCTLCACVCHDMIVCRPSNVSVMTWMFADMYTVCVS